jgi:hypothetical protein
MEVNTNRCIIYKALLKDANPLENNNRPLK